MKKPDQSIWDPILEDFSSKRNWMKVRVNHFLDSHISVVQPADTTSFEDSDEVLILPSEETEEEIKEIKTNRGIFSAVLSSFCGEFLLGGST